MKKPSFMALLTFALTFVCCCALIGVSIRYKLNAERFYMESLILEKSSSLNILIPRLLCKTHILKTLVLQGDGKIENFDEIAKTIIDEPSIMNVSIAPNGVVSEIYPLEGNEAVVGLDLLAEKTSGSKEANFAKDSGNLVFSGPIDIVQGGQALVGRQPVFLEDDASENGSRFWGIVSIALRYQALLEEAGFETIERLGYEYELWRINPDDGEKQVIASGLSETEEDVFRESAGIERHIKIVDADWWLRIFPLQGPFDYAEAWIMLLIGFCVSLMAALLMQRNYELKILKSELEGMAYTDELTCAFNRRYFLEASNLRISRLKYSGRAVCSEGEKGKENGEESETGESYEDYGAFIILFDIDNFKSVNDIHGHKAGDYVLREIAGIAASMIRPYDLFARYGGDEFVIFIMDADKELAVSIAERIFESFSQRKFDFSVNVSASFGIASVLPYDDVQAAIALADKALYMAKNKGRGRVEVYGEYD